MRLLLRTMLVVGIALQLLALAGCSSTPVAPVDRSRTSVVLLPDEDGKVGAVLISSPQGEQRLASAYGMTTVGADPGTAPHNVQTNEATVQSTYREVLNAAPTRPAAFTLYFELGTAILTPASRRELPKLFAAVRGRIPTEISIYGHSDSIGSDRRNYRLSEMRAKLIERLLRKDEPTINAIEVKFLGDREPLVPTPDNVPEPRNRRAEVVVL